MTFMNIKPLFITKIDVIRFFSDMISKLKFSKIKVLLFDTVILISLILSIIISLEFSRLKKNLLFI